MMCGLSCIGSRLPHIPQMFIAMLPMTANNGKQLKMFINMGLDRHIMAQSYNGTLWNNKVIKLDLNLSV